MRNNQKHRKNSYNNVCSVIEAGIVNNIVPRVIKHERSDLVSRKSLYLPKTNNAELPLITDNINEDEVIEATPKKVKHHFNRKYSKVKPNNERVKLNKNPLKPEIKITRRNAPGSKNKSETLGFPSSSVMNSRHPVVSRGLKVNYKEKMKNLVLEIQVDDLLKVSKEKKMTHLEMLQDEIKTYRECESKAQAYNKIVENFGDVYQRSVKSVTVTSGDVPAKILQIAGESNYL